MSATLWTMTLLAAIGQGPGCSTCNSGGGYSGGYSGGYASGGYMGGSYGGDYGYGGMGVMGGGVAGSYEPLFPFDYYDNWVHGYWQEIPSYGGYHFFRPYNYRHVYSQTQTAAGWGMSPGMGYSQEYFRRHREHALNTIKARQGEAVQRPELASTRPAAPVYGPQPNLRFAGEFQALPEPSSQLNVNPTTAASSQAQGQNVNPAVHSQQVVAPFLNRDLVQPATRQSRPFFGSRSK